MMIIRGVNVFPTQIEELLLDVPELSPHYLITLSRDGNLDTVSIDTELNAGVDSSAKERAAKQLQQRIKTMIGISCIVSVCDSGHIARSEGKAKRVNDLR